MVALSDVNAAIYAHLNVTTLKSIATGGVYAVMAPQSAALPYVVFGINSGGATNETPRQAADLTISVIAVADHPGTAMQAADAIHTLMHETVISGVGGWHDWRSQQAGMVQYSDTQDGRTYWYAGGTYRVRSAKE